MRPESPAGGAAVREAFARVRGDRTVPPDASVVIPVNARADLDGVWDVLGDLVRYDGAHAVEAILVVNNYDPGHPPPQIEAYERAGVQVVSRPAVWRQGEAVALSARVPGIRAAGSQHVVLFDADVTIPNPTALLDWYVERLAGGCDAAYTRVDFCDLRPIWSVRVKVFLHHLARAAKRVLLRIPTTRGSNYAVRRSAFLRLYDQGMLADDLNVGPTLKAAGGRVAYSGAARLAVLTSGRTFTGSWRRMLRQWRYRLRYNLGMLPVRPNSERPPYHARNIR